MTAEEEGEFRSIAKLLFDNEELGSEYNKA
jgi:hypothetical protein